MSTSFTTNTDSVRILLSWQEAQTRLQAEQFLFFFLHHCNFPISVLHAAMVQFSRDANNVNNRKSTKGIFQLHFQRHKHESSSTNRERKIRDRLKREGIQKSQEKGTVCCRIFWIEEIYFEYTSYAGHYYCATNYLHTYTLETITKYLLLYNFYRSEIQARMIDSQDVQAYRVVIKGLISYYPFKAHLLKNLFIQPMHVDLNSS